MFKLVFAVILAIFGALSIFQYGKGCANSHKQKFDWLVVLACFDLMIAGMNIAAAFHK